MSGSSTIVGWLSRWLWKEDIHNIPEKFIFIALLDIWIFVEVTTQIFIFSVDLTEYYYHKNVYIPLIKTTPITICYIPILINKITASRSYLKEVLEFFFFSFYLTHKKIIDQKKKWYYGNLFGIVEVSSDCETFNTC